MMVSIQASVSGSNFVKFCKFMLALLVLCLCSEHGPICHLFELILVIHANTSNGTNHIV
jgi:hypothetical protein